jgi:hypothetical protein
VYLDKLLSVDTAVGKLSDVREWSIPLRGFTTVWNGTGGSNDIHNGLFAAIVSDSGAAPHPSFQLSWRLSYTDV